MGEEMKRKPLAIKILEREAKEGVSIVQKEIERNPKILKSDIMMYVPGLIGARAVIELFDEMFKTIKPKKRR